MRFSVLGPLEIVSGDRVLDIGGPRQRHTLAALLLDAGRVVSISRLAEAVWETTPPATAKEQIQNDVSMLRRAFADVEPDNEVISTRPPGYVLEIRSNEVDVSRFSDQVAEARKDVEAGQIHMAVARMRTALEVWRGPAFDGLSSRLLRAGAAQLNETRVAVLEERIGLELELGMHRSLIGELSALVTEYPLREELHAHLMLALYRSGRRAEALDVYRRAHRTFVEELGLDPTGLLRGLEQSMLSSDPALDLPLSVSTSISGMAIPRQLPHDVPLFGVSRNEADVRAALTETRPDDSRAQRLCVIKGAGGTGKTALAVGVANAVRASFPDGQLFADLGSSSGAAMDFSTVLGRFLRALGVPVPDALQEQVEAYRDALVERRVLVVLDDVGDESALWPLIPTGSTCGVIVTTRSHLTSMPGARRVSTEPLSLSAAVELLAACAGGDRVTREADATRQVVELCGRLPLAVCGAGARLAAKQHWTVEKLAKVLRHEGLRFDELARGGSQIREIFAAGYERLDLTARLVFRRAGLVPTQSLPAWAYADLAEVTVVEAEAALEEAVDLWLMEATGQLGPEPWYGCTQLSGMFARERVWAEESERDRLTSLARQVQQRAAGVCAG